MPGWFVHMDVARMVADRLAAEDVAAELGYGPGQARAAGDNARKWRNYLAIGALGPDLFYLLPDFKKDAGNILLTVISWALDEWSKLDELFVGSWEKWNGPVAANDADLTNALSLGLSSQLSQALSEINAAEMNLVETMITRLHDWFGELTSGPPQGLADSAFYWSDMLHYRRTYDFARVLHRMAADAMAAALQMQADLTAGGAVPTPDQQMQIDDAIADAEAETAFALGWMTHCATDVTGHAFTNAKSGGPYRLHWQRHHLVENHFDAAAYDMGHHGAATYEELGTSALHFRIAFRTRTEAPYDGRHDAPAYDYFAGFPAYPTGDTAIEDEVRTRFFDMDPGELPDHLVGLLLGAMREVYGNDPSVLVDAPAFADPIDPADPNSPPSGRPNAAALNVMWNIVFRYLRMVSSDGYHPRRPMPPPLFTPDPFPAPPGSSLPAEDDGRGGDPDDDTNAHGHSFNLIDFLAALLSWVKYIEQVGEWLASLPGLALDPLTFPARETLYYTVIAPLYSMFMASRKLLVMEGFLAPKPEEIDAGLTTLGIGTSFARQSLAADLADALGFAPTGMPMSEPSGRRDITPAPGKPGDAFGVDMAFPRQSMKDPVPELNQVLAPFGTSLPLGEERYSHWTMPWAYPETDLEGDRIGWEPDRLHVGPWKQGQVATALFDANPTDPAAAKAFETAATPQDTFDACEAFLPDDRHLGGPVDYSLFIARRLADGEEVASFNLDSDRGYAFRCWDYVRHAALQVPPNTPDDFACRAPFGVPRFSMMQPCTVPEQFKPEWSADDVHVPRPVLNRYRPFVPLAVRYVDVAGGPAPCTDVITTAAIPDVTLEEMTVAGMRPDGTGIG